VHERYRLARQTFQGGQSFFVAAAKGGDGGDVADEEGADEMVFAGAEYRSLILNPSPGHPFRRIVSGLR